MALFAGDGSLNEMIKTLGKLASKGAKGNFFLIQVEHPVKGRIYYAIPASVIPLLIGWGTYCPIHEVASKQTRCVFMDIDYTASDRNYNHLKNAVIRFKELARSMLDYPVKFIVMESIRPDKISMHIICPNLICASIVDMKEFIMSIVEKLDFDLRRYFDTAPYRKNAHLRIIGTSKAGIPLALSEWSDLPEADTDLFMSTPSALGIDYVRSIHPNVRVLGDPDAVETVSGSTFKDKLLPSTIPRKVVDTLNSFCDGDWRFRTNSTIVEFPNGWDCPIHQRHHDADNGSVFLGSRFFRVYCFRRDADGDGRAGIDEKKYAQYPY